MNPLGPIAASTSHLPDVFHTARLRVRAPRTGDGLAVFQAVAERAGYTLVGIKRHERLSPDGPLHETCVYAMEP